MQRRKPYALKNRIVAGGLPVRLGYRDPMALGALVLRDMTEVIDRLLPEGSEPSWFDRERIAHQAFATARTQVYVGQEAYLDWLDAHLKGEGPPLVVRGAPGSGKSALLANWVEQVGASIPGVTVVAHFGGATAYSTEWAAMLRRIMGELSRSLGIEVEVPSEPHELRRAFANSLHLAAAQGRILLILDGLERLEDRDAAPELGWLPTLLPANVRLVVSSLPGRPLDELQRRG
jgi:hypothetical protein